MFSGCPIVGTVLVREPSGASRPWHISDVLTVAAVHSFWQVTGHDWRSAGLDWEDAIEVAKAEARREIDAGDLDSLSESGEDCGLRTIPLKELEDFAGMLLCETGMGWAEIQSMCATDLVRAWIAAMRYVSQKPSGCAWYGKKK